MAALCPVLNTPEEKAKWNKLVQLSGDETAAYRMFYRYAHTTDPVSEALSRFDIGRYKIEDKIKDIQDVSRKVRKQEGFDPATGEPIHNYYDQNNRLLVSVSRVLDTNDLTRYRGGQTIGSQYSDKGTAIHKLFEMYIKFDGAQTSRENILKFAKENGISDFFVSNVVVKTVDYLKTKGKILSEIMVADLDSDVAGTIDIPVLNYDGTVDIYDIKTAHRTPNTKGKIWDPVNHYDGYKAKRYPAQLEFYGRMLERILGQPVSNKYIIPIEIAYKEDDPLKGFDDIKALPFENVAFYGSNELASTIVSDYFHDNKPTKEMPKLASIDDSGELMRTITGGRIEAKSSDLDRDADEILDNPAHHNIYQGIKFYYNKIQKKNIRLKDQSNRAAQRRQIIDEYLSKINTGRDNVDESIRNYLTTGRDAFLDSGEIPSKHIKDMLNIYKGRKNIRVSKLTDVEGFKDKKGWILIEDGDVNKGGTYDLLYLGNDNLDETLNVGKKLKQGDTLFAKYFSSREASLILGSTLKNNIADAKKFESALIALKLKEAVPSANFRRILIYSTNSAHFPVQYGDLYKLLPVVKKFGEQKPTLIPTNMQSVFKDEKLFQPQQYRQNMLEAYKAFISIHSNSRENRQLTNEVIDAYEKEKNGMEQLAYSALAEARRIEQAGLAQDPVHAEEMRILRGIYYNLEKIGQEVYPIGFKGGKFSMPQNLPPDVIQDINVKMSDALYRIREKFWDGYKKPTQRYFNSIFSAFYTLDGARDAVISDTDRYYEPLLEKVKKKAVVGRDEAGNSIVKEQDVYTYNLVNEGSDAFKALTKEQQDFIRMFNDRVQEAMGIMGIEWKRGAIPLVPSSYRNQLYRAYKLGVGSTVNHYQDAMRKMFTEFEASFSDTVKAENEFSAGSANIFRAQANGPTFDNRDGFVGFSDDFVNLEEHSKWETNLEMVLDLSMMTAYRSDEMAKVNDIVLAAKNHFDWQRTNLFEERLGANIRWIKDYRTANIENRDIDAGKWYNKTVRTANQVASFALLGFSPGVALASTIGAQAIAASQAVSNSLAQNGRYTAKNWSAAFGKIINPRNWKKVNLLLDQYKMYNLDMSSLLNGYHRYGDRSIFKMKWAYGFLNAGDWLSRSQVLVANMLQDGVWDAYSVDEAGNLIYDEAKDSRDPLLKKTIKENLKKDNPEYVSPDGKMLRAYDHNITRSIKGQIDMVMGGYDRETRGMYNFYALGRLFGLFKTYMPSRIDALTSAPFQSRMIGKYELGTDENGNKQYVWKGDQLEGMFHSMNMGVLYLQKLGTGNEIELSAQQKSNIARFAGDFLMFGMVALAMYGITDDDDETKIDDFAAYALYGAVRDLVSFYNVLGYAQFISTPIALSFLQNTAKRIYNIAMNAPDPDSNTLIDTIELHNAAQDYHEVVDYLYDEPSN